MREVWPPLLFADKELAERARRVVAFFRSAGVTSGPILTQQEFSLGVMYAIGIGRSLAAAPLPHDRTYGSAYAGSNDFFIVEPEGLADPTRRNRRPVRLDYSSSLSPEFRTGCRSPRVSSTAFGAQLPDLQPSLLMDLDFVVTGRLVRPRMPRIRFVFIGCAFAPRFLQIPPHGVALALR